MNPSQSLVLDAVIVARDQASSLSRVLANLPRRTIRSIVVVDNGSKDGTASVARDAGAVVLREPRVGYGAACQRAIAHLASLPTPPDVVVFMAADGSDDPADLPALIAPIAEDNAELVIGVRRAARRRRPQARVVIQLIKTIYGHRFDDLSGYRAIRFPALIALALADRGGGLDVEMLVKAIKLGLHIAEIPVQGGDTGASRSANQSSMTRLRGSIKTTGRVLFHIVRHSTSR